MIRDECHKSSSSDDLQKESASSSSDDLQKESAASSSSSSSSSAAEEERAKSPPTAAVHKDEEEKEAEDLKKKTVVREEEGEGVEDTLDDEEVQTKKKSRKRIIDDGTDDEEEPETQQPPTKKGSGEEQPGGEGEPAQPDRNQKSKEEGTKRKDAKEDRHNKDPEKRKDRRDSHHERSKGRGGEREKKEKERGGKDDKRDREKSRHKSSRDKDKGRERDTRGDKGRSGGGGKDKEKDRDKRKEQAEKDKATLDKIKPLSTEGLAKIPRKATPSVKSPSGNPVSFLDALGSADADLPELKRSSAVVKTKSRGFRNTGLLDETIKPPGVAGKRSAEASLKKHTSFPSASEVPDHKKTTKASPSSAPPVGDRPGGVKLISPKRPTLSDDGGFMAALTAAGADRKKIIRKRKSSESDVKGEGHLSKSSKVEAPKEQTPEEGGKGEEELATPLKGSDEDAKKTPEELTENGPLVSPTSVKPTLNFYKETLVEDNTAKDSKQDGDETSPEVKESTDSTTSGPSEDSQETSPSTADGPGDDDAMDLENNGDEDSKEESMEIGGGSDGEMDGDGDASSVEASPNLKGSDDYVTEAPVPAPAQEDYEKIEVVFASSVDLKGVIVYHRTPGRRKKKVVKWKPEGELKEVFYFPMDETERVNVNTVKFNEMMMMEKAREKELMFGKQRNRLLAETSGLLDSGMPNTCIDYAPYKLYPVHLPNPPSVTPGCKSIEKHVQAQREHATMASFFHPSMLPDTPTEPDPEMVQRTEPVIIPLNDVTGADSISDNRGIPWPEPLFNPPEYSFMPNAGNTHQTGPPQPSGGHWVLGNHTVPRYNAAAGPPMFGGGSGPQGPAMNQGGFGPPPPPPPPQGFPGDMRGGWAGPNDFGAPPVLLPNGPHMGMPQGVAGPSHGIQGGPPMQTGPGPGTMPVPGPGHNMGMGTGPPMGNRDNYPRYRRGGNNWGGPHGGRGYCKHFRYGNCRHGDDCKYLHVPS